MAIHHPVIRRCTARQGCGDAAGVARAWIKKVGRLLVAGRLTQQHNNHEQADDHPSKQDRLGLSHSATPGVSGRGRRPLFGLSQGAALGISLDYLIGTLEDRVRQ